MLSQPRNSMGPANMMMVQYCAIETGLGGGGGGMIWKGKQIHVSRRIPFYFISPEFSPVFTVATGEIRGIRFPQNTWENEWKRVKTSEKILVWFPRIPLNFPRIPLNFPRIRQNSPEFPQNFPRIPQNFPEFTGPVTVFFSLPPPCPGRILPVSWNLAQTFLMACLQQWIPSFSCSFFYGWIWQTLFLPHIYSPEFPQNSPEFPRIHWPSDSVFFPATSMPRKNTPSFLKSRPNIPDGLLAAVDSIFFL